ncbi:MAG: glycoside hydrolase family 2 TIM barrel-domain containing protein [Terracidiphilus sp.]
MALTVALVVIAALGPQALAKSATRETLNADAGWKFLLGDPAGAESTSFDDAGWTKVDLPHDWSIAGPIDQKNPTAGGGGFFPAGIGWYRKSFTAPAEWTGKLVSVEFEGVSKNATVYLNGEKLGFHPYAYTSFRFDLTPHLKIGEPNVLAVKVDDSEQPSSRWFSGSGIYRHVHVIVTEPVHVAPWGVFVSTPEASADTAKLEVRARVENASGSAAPVTVRTTIEPVDGKPVAKGQSQMQVAAGGDEETSQDIRVAHPKLWSPESPTLYRAVVEVVQAGKVTDRVETTFGIRTLAWSVNKGLLLNGNPIKLAGGSVHHDNGPLGAAAFDRAEERRVELLKAAGFNAVRTAHNPPSPAFLDACDRLGLLVLDEPFDVWTTSKVKYDYAQYFNEWWQRDIDSMVLRDRNHPAIVLWGIGNEIPEAWTEKGAPIAKELAARVRALDATRPLTQAFPGATYTPSTDAVMANLDIVGYNYNLVINQSKDHARVPTRMMVTTESLPASAFDEWKTVHEHPYIVGEFVWTAMDYLGESGIGSWSYATPELAQQATMMQAMMKQRMADMGANGKNPFAGIPPPPQPTDKPKKPSPLNLLFPGYPWHAADCGDMDLTGHRKPQSYYRDILWHGGDRVYATVRLPEPEGKKIVAIGWSVYPTLPSWTWPGEEGKEMQVDVYAGTEKVRLYLNGKLIGEAPTTVDQERKATFTVHYEPGTLKAVGVNGDHVVATDLLETASAPAKLRLTADRDIVQADGEDLSFVTAEALDAQGRLQPNAAQEVKFAISGPGTIAAVGNADGMSDASYQGDHRALYEGRALVVIRTAHKAGKINLAASAECLTPAAIAIESKTAQTVVALDR